MQSCVEFLKYFVVRLALILFGAAPLGAQSPYYDVDILAKAGDITQDGDTITDIRRQVSVNDAGKVAFVATLDEYTGSHLLVVSKGQRPRRISTNTDGRSFAFPQINDTDKIVARDFFGSDASQNQSFNSLKLWDELLGNEFGLLASSTEFEAILAPSLANDDSVGFTARRRPEPGDIGNEFPPELFSNTFGALDTNDRVAELPNTTSRPMTASGGTYVLRSGSATNGTIYLYRRKPDQIAWEALSLVSTNDVWRQLGAAPSISDSGKVIAFSGEHPRLGQGIYIVFDDPEHPDLLATFPIAGGGEANVGAGIRFEDFEPFFNQRVGVVHVEDGLPGLQDDRVIVTFMGQLENRADDRGANSALLDNPTIPGKQPLLFDFKPGLWTTEITLTHKLNDRNRTGSLQLANRTSALPVVQTGDYSIVDFELHDPLAPARRNVDRTPRPAINPSDHHVAFWGKTVHDTAVVGLASYLDPDADGLPDHWERPGGGIDIDRDGTIDLPLAEFGANPQHKDLFLEIDWVSTDNPEGASDTNENGKWDTGEPFSDINGDGKANVRTFAPQQEAIDFLVDLFAKAPLSNPDGNPGVRLHVDAGINLSRNMGNSSRLLAGGSLISTVSGAHIHEVYHSDEAGTPPGFRDATFERDWVSVPLHEIKRVFFGENSKNARELAFRYAVMGDQLSDPRVGRLLGIAEAISAERGVVGADPRFLPGNDMLLALGGRTKLKSGILKVIDPAQGAPTTVPEPPGFFQGQLLAHELGHILGLLHGGWDHQTARGRSTPRPGYFSVMNYGYDLYPDRNGKLTRDYSRSEDSPVTFHDWNRVRLGFARHLDSIGDSFRSRSRIGTLSGGTFDGRARASECQVHGCPCGQGRLDQFEAIHGPMALNETFDAPQAGRDQGKPLVTLTAPAPGGSVMQLQTLAVNVTAFDASGIGSVQVAFDIDGDGFATGDDEVVPASSTGGAGYRATFANITGAAETRTLEVMALDSSFNRSVVSRDVMVTPESTPPDVSIVSPAPNTDVFLSSVLEVDVRATDNFALDRVDVAFDLNGDGDTTDVGEETTAFPTGDSDLFRAQFQNLAGAAGSRTLRATARDAGGNEKTAQVSVNVNAGGTSGQLLHSVDGTIPEQRTWLFGGSRQSQAFPELTVPGRGSVTFRVTSTPPVRKAAQNISRADSTVRDVVFNGESKRLTVECNDFGADPAICESTLVVDDGGTLSGTVLGPGQWNTFGEFVGHVEQSYTLEVLYEPEDVVPPLVEITTPAPGAAVNAGSSVIVDVSAIDSGGITEVEVHLDRNGDGDTTDAGESIDASAQGGGTFRASFGALSGAPGARSMRAVVTDTAGNETTYESFVKAGGLGAGGVQTLSQTGGLIGAQPIGYNGRNGRRQSRPFSPIEIPGAGRVTLAVRSTPNVRKEVRNIERHDSAVWEVDFNGERISLNPDCNAHGSNPAICTSVFDTTEAGVISGSVLGPATFTVFNEFAGHVAQQYYLDVTFESGPDIVGISPATGSTGGHTSVTITGGGFKENAVVLFNGVAAKDTQLIDSTQIRCVTPPGTIGEAEVRVLNPDADGQPWNYGSTYGLFGSLAGGYTYQVPPDPPPSEERLIATYQGRFDATKIAEIQESTSVDLDLPGAGSLRLEAWAFLPILSPIAGIDDPNDLTELNTSTKVTFGRGGNGGSLSVTEGACTPINFAWGPVICESSATVTPAAVGTGQLTISGPARWSARWKALEVCENLGAPEQHWSVAVWYTPSDPGPGGNSFDSWVAEQFTIAERLNPSISGANADPDNDTIPNRSEFVLNGDPKRADGANLLAPTIAQVGALSYPAIEFSIRDDLAGEFVVLQRSTNLIDWITHYDIAADSTRTSPLIAVKQPVGIGVTRLTILNQFPVTFLRQAVYYRLAVGTVGGNGDGKVTGTSTLTFDIDGFSNFSNMSQDYGDRVTGLDMDSFHYLGTGGFTPNVEVSYGADGADPAFWTTGYGDLENILFEDRDNFGQLEITFTADDGYLVQLHRWDMSAWTSAFSTEPAIDRVAVLDKDGNALWERENEPISHTAHTAYEFSSKPFEDTILTLRFESGNLGNLSDDIAFDNVVFGQRPQ